MTAAVVSGRATDGAVYKEVLGRFCTGLTIVTSMGPGGPIGFTCQSFGAMSLDPPMVYLGAQVSSTTWPKIAAERRFAVSVLSAEQAGLAMQFARSGTDKFAGVSYTSTPGGLPVIDDSLAWLECDIRDQYDAGDHVVAIADVRGLGVVSDDAPLLFFRGQMTSTVSGGT